MNFEHYKDTLMKVPLFKNINEVELENMLTCFHTKIKAYKKDSFIVFEGDPFTGIGIIVEGGVVIQKENEQGERVLISKFSEGGMFGEMVAFSRIDRWPATVQASAKTAIIFIDPTMLITTCGNLCDGHRQLIMNMLTLVSNKALVLNKKVEYLSKKSMRGKIAKYIIEQRKPHKKAIFQVDMNRNELADFLNVSRPSMSRELGRMKEEGIIDYNKNTFRVIDLEALKEAAAL